MRKNSIKFALFLLCAAFTHTALNGVWWTVQSKQKVRKAINYATAYGTHLRDNATLFSSVPKTGKIRWYHVLGVEKGANDEESRKAHRRVVAATHVDQHTRNNVSNPELIKAVNAAREEVKTTSEYAVQWNGTFNSRFGNFDKQGPGTVPCIESLTEFFILGDEEDKAKQVDDSTFAEKFKKLTTDWKQFYIMQFALLSGMVVSYNYLKKLTESDKDSWLKNNKTIQQFISWQATFKKEHPKTATLLSVCNRGGFIALASIYPLYRFRKIFPLASLNRDFRSETMHFDEISDDNLKMFHKMVHVGTIKTTYTDGSTSTSYIHEPSPPIGYMTSEQDRKEFMPIRKAQVMSAIMIATSIAATWLGCAW